MKIHSNFKDYYDSVAYTADLRNEDPLEKHYVRNESQMAFKDHALAKFATDYEDDLLWSRHNADHNALTVIRSVSYTLSKGVYLSLSGFMIFFAGKRYPGVKVLDPSLNLRKIPERITECVFDVDRLYEVAAKYDITMTERNMFVKHLQSSREAPGLKDAMISNRISIAVVDRDSRDNLIFYHNPCLKNYDCSKILDPYTAYQELSQWVDGALAEPDAPEPLVDKVRIQQHGFDLKTSFRKSKIS